MMRSFSVEELCVFNAQQDQISGHMWLGGQGSNVVKNKTRKSHAMCQLFVANGHILVLIGLKMKIV
ncbi:hypothetical protein [Vreelandella massiliensis]|uniref:hypothetical protein n=1 Tax=Vreelandella massiliensis TaxID=1816686 RepID=UPI00096AB7BA|nr:hypothetical protein [Halomonas massiliensis]